jgi:hypothetical protein
MDNRTWLIELVMAACILVVAIVAFGLMIGHSLWKNLAGK